MYEIWDIYTKTFLASCWLENIWFSVYAISDIYGVQGLTSFLKLWRRVGVIQTNSTTSYLDGAHNIVILHEACTVDTRTCLLEVDILRQCAISGLCIAWTPAREDSSGRASSLLQLDQLDQVRFQTCAISTVRRREVVTSAI